MQYQQTKVNQAVKAAMSAIDAKHAFSDAIADSGIVFTGDIIADGQLHRAHVEGDKRGTRNGAYILHLDGNPAGWAMHYVTGERVTWTASGKREPMPLAMRLQIEAERQQRQLEIQERNNEAADKAHFTWHRAQPITEQSQHPYLVKKQVEPHGLRLSSNGDGALLVPIYSAERELVNLQKIYPDGTKRFLSGGRKKGCFAVIGKPTGDQLLICEGWATGASLFEVSGFPVLVALDAGNLGPVALAARSLWPDARIVIAGDHDESGTGQKASRAAALACGGKYLVPSTPGMDWNDVINDRDINALKVAEAILSAVGGV